MKTLLEKAEKFIKEKRILNGDLSGGYNLGVKQFANHLTSLKPEIDGELILKGEHWYHPKAKREEKGVKLSGEKAPHLFPRKDFDSTKPAEKEIEGKYITRIVWIAGNEWLQFIRESDGAIFREVKIEDKATNGG